VADASMTVPTPSLAAHVGPGDGHRVATLGHRHVGPAPAAAIDIWQMTQSSWGRRVRVGRPLRYPTRPCSCGGPARVAGRGRRDLVEADHPRRAGRTRGPRHACMVPPARSWVRSGPARDPTVDARRSGRARGGGVTTTSPTEPHRCAAPARSTGCGSWPMEQQQSLPYATQMLARPGCRRGEAGAPLNRGRDRAGEGRCPALTDPDGRPRRRDLPAQQPRASAA